MDERWDDEEIDSSVQELWSELQTIRKNGHGSRPRARRAASHGLKIEIGVLLIAVAVGVAAAVSLFSHSFSYTAPTAKLSTTCSALTAATSGAMILFSCNTNPAIAVASAASGTVTYSSFSPAPPTNILDIYLIDTAATSGVTCATTSSAGNEPVALNAAGASITISATAGNLRPGHNYNYCMDYAVLPPSFTTGVSWSQ